MFDEAVRFREASLSNTTSVEDAAEAARTGVARIPWDRLGTDGERTLRGRGVSVRCLQREDGSVPDDDDEPGLLAIAARAY